MALTRRQFIRISGIGAGSAIAAAHLSSAAWGSPADAIPDPRTDGERVVPTFCEMCFWKCGVLAHVRNGRVTKLVGNPAHPLSRGKLCPRGVGGTGLLYDPDRLKKPLMRRDKRGSQSFEEVSWDAALNRVAEEMQTIQRRYGPEAFALFSHGFGGSWFKAIMKGYGTPNVTAPSYAQCRGARETGFTLTYGAPVGSPEAVDMRAARVITFIGSHLGENMHNTQVQDLSAAVRNGARIIVVDPRFSVVAGKADHWLPIRPGTDIALLLAWMHVIVSEGLYDHEYVAQYTSGFDALRRHLRDKTPEWAFTETGIRPEEIVETARVIAGGRPASLVHPGRRANWYGDDTQRARAVACLAALLGSWGRTGGYLFPAKLSVPKVPAPAAKPMPDAVDMLPDQIYPFADHTLAHGIRNASIPGTAEYDIHGWMIYGTNLLHAIPQPKKTLAALQALDFVVAIDILPAEITGWADVVLPECTYLERWDDIHAPAYREPYAAIRQPVVPPLHESKPGWWIATELGKRLGLQDYCYWGDSAEKYVARRIEAAGYNFADVRKSGVIHGKRQPVTIEEGVEPEFATPSGKIEFESQQMADAGLDPLPTYRPPKDPPPGMLRLLIGRSPVHTFGRSTNNRVLGEIQAKNEIWINSKTARELGFDNGELVALTNQDGARVGPVALRATERLRHDCVFTVHGFGHTAQGLHFGNHRGIADTDLMTRSVIDPAMGATAFNVNFVQLERWSA